MNEERAERLAAVFAAGLIGEKQPGSLDGILGRSGEREKRLVSVFMRELRTSGARDATK